jgi:uncharacterized membrane protein
MKKSLAIFLFQSILIAPIASVFLSVTLYYSTNIPAFLTCQGIEAIQNKQNCLSKEIDKIPKQITLAGLVLPFCTLVGLEIYFAYSFFSQKKASVTPCEIISVDEPK